MNGAARLIAAIQRACVRRFSLRDEWLDEGLGT